MPAAPCFLCRLGIDHASDRLIAVAVATFFVWSEYGPEPRLAPALVNAVAVLIIACVTGIVDGRSVAVGNLRHVEALGLDPGVLRDRADTLRREGPTVMFVVVDGRPGGLVGVADPVKLTATSPLAKWGLEWARGILEPCA